MIPRLLTSPNLRGVARRGLLLVSVLLVAFGIHMGRRAVAGPVPEGLTAADWSQISAMLPDSSAPEQQAYLKGINAQAGSYFGWSVAMDGDTVVVGAPYEDSAGEASAGAAYVFVRNGATWSRQAYLKAENAEAGDFFGISVAVNGDTVVVGAFRENGNAAGDPDDNSAPWAGAAYVFARNGTSWSQQAYLKAENAEADDWFGESVAVSGDTVVVGANGEDGNSASGPDDNSAEGAGATYVFTRSDGTWSQQAYLKAANVGIGDVFGSSVAVEGDTAVIGAWGEDSNGIDGPEDNSGLDVGAAYVFTRSGQSWSQQAYLKGDNAANHDHFGDSVDVDGDTVVVGAYLKPGNGKSFKGAAYVFTRNGVVWSQQAYLEAANGGASNYFGHSVAVDGDTVIGGAYGEAGNGVGGPDEKSAPGAGAAYVFTRDGVSWSQQGYLKGAVQAWAYGWFGYAVAVDGDTVVIGAPFEDGNGRTDAGAAYVFTRSGGTWNRQAHLKAANAEGHDFFGVSVAINGDTIVVGAPEEDGNDAGDPNDNSAEEAGAAYVFVRSGETWSQQAYLKASNTGEYDHFGHAVAVDDDTVIVGAPYEASNGMDGPDDNSAPQAGAAYVFVRTGPSWSQQAYLKAANADATDRFGNAVTLDGDTVVVGAHYEAGNGTGGPDDNSAGLAGAAYVFVRNGATWSQQAYLKAANAGYGDEFGTSVAVAGDTVVIGAWTEAGNGTGGPTDNSSPNAGAAYVFTRSGSTWSQQAYLKAANADAHDRFGLSVDIDGDTAVVGAWSEAGNGTDGPGDNSAFGAGAAYVFTRNGESWNQLAYLKAANADAGDYFGNSVVVSSDTVIIGAPSEASNGTDGLEDNSAPGAGAVYVFILPAVTATPTPTMTATSTATATPTPTTTATSTSTVTASPSATPTATVTVATLEPADEFAYLPVIIHQK